MLDETQLNSLAPTPALNTSRGLTGKGQKHP